MGLRNNYDIFQEVDRLLQLDSSFRLGQFVSNFIDWYKVNGKTDLFYVSDNELKEYVFKYCEYVKKYII